MSNMQCTPDLDLYRRLPARLKAQWAMAWLSQETFYADLCGLFPDPNERLELLLLMDASLEAILWETAP